MLVIVMHGLRVFMVGGLFAMQVNRLRVSKVVKDKGRSRAVSPLLMLLRGVCCLALSNCVLDPPVTSLLHMRSAPSLSFLRLVGQQDYVIPVTTTYSL